MHSANFTELFRAAALGSPPALALLDVPLLLAVPLLPAGAAVLVPSLLLVPPQLALMTASTATTARAAGDRSVLLMDSP
jgi:hypothetical protein